MRTEADVPIRRYGQLLVRYLRPQRGRALLLGVLLCTSIVLQLANPQIVRAFLDAASGTGPLEDLWVAALAFLAVAVVQQISAVATSYVSENVGWTATNLMRADLAEHCLRLDLSFHKRHTPGELIERIDGDVNALANFFSQLVVRVLGNGLVLAGVLVLMFREDWRLGLGFAVFAVLALASLNQVRNVAVPHFVTARQSTAAIIGFIQERIAGTEDIRSGGFVPHVMRRFYDLQRDRLRKQQKSASMGSFVFSTNQAVFTLGYGMTFTLGAWLFGAGALSLGAVYLAVHYMEMLQRPLSQITQQMEDLQKAGASVTRIDALLRTENAVPDGAGGAGGAGAPLPTGPLSVELDRVSFAYADEPEGHILSDVSFHLGPGKALGLLGRTGSGKSTLVKLVFRFHDATSGAVRVGGADVRTLRVADLRRRIGMVTQDVQLFHATVRQNLTFFQEGIPDEQIMAALERLGLSDWFRALPEGLDTELAAGAAGLSAGEQQLLAFTRVFLRDPGLVILDEASSRLDPATERLVEAAVDRLLEHRTAIVIAHRLHTVERADDVLVLEGGRVVEYGPRARLGADAGSRYGRLLRTGAELALA